MTEQAYVETSIPAEGISLVNGILTIDIGNNVVMKVPTPEWVAAVTKVTIVVQIDFERKLDA